MLKRRFGCKGGINWKTLVHYFLTGQKWPLTAYKKNLSGFFTEVGILDMCCNNFRPYQTWTWILIKVK